MFKFKDRVKVVSGFYEGMIGRIVIIGVDVDVDGNRLYMLVASKTISHKSKFGELNETTVTETTKEIWVNEKDMLFIGEPKRTFMDYIIPIFGLFAVIGIVFSSTLPTGFKSTKQSKEYSTLK